MSSSMRTAILRKARRSVSNVALRPGEWRGAIIGLPKQALENLAIPLGDDPRARTDKVDPANHPSGDLLGL